MRVEADLPRESEIKRIYYQHIGLPSAKEPLARDARRAIGSPWQVVIFLG